MLKKRYRLKSEQGDTLIEVLLAITILAVVMVGTMSLMNRGIALTYASLERSQIRVELNKQIEYLQYFHDTYIKSKSSSTIPSENITYAADTWLNIRDHPTVTNTASTTNDCVATASDAHFFDVDESVPLTEQKVRYSTYTAPTSAVGQLPVPGKGIWIEVTRTIDKKVPYVDAYVKACWQSAAGEGEQVMSSTVRLYDIN